MTNDSHEISEKMKGLLGRVLSEEIAKQEHWSVSDIATFGTDHGRAKTIDEIKDFMTTNDIAFSQEDYISMKSQLEMR